jgi:hypothetical protein
MRRLVLIAITILLVGASVVMAADVPTASGPGGPGRGVTPEAVNAILLDQPLSATNTNAYANQDFTDYDTYDIYIADDFTVPAGGWQISAIFVPSNAWNPGGPISCGTTLHFEIYADAGGVPAGYPGSTPPVWSLAAVPADPQFTITAGTGAFLTNVLATPTVQPTLAPGTYWLVSYVTASYATCGQFGRQVADTVNGNVAMVINPGGGFTYPTVWTSIQSATTWALTQHDLAFRIEGVALPVELQTVSIE